MDAHVRRLGKFIILELSGRVDDFHTDIVREELETILSTGRLHVAIGLAGVTSLSARCVLGWLDIYEQLLARGGGMALIGPKGESLELIESSGLPAVLPLVRSADELERIEFPRLEGRSTVASLVRTLAHVPGLGWLRRRAGLVLLGLAIPDARNVVLAAGDMGAGKEQIEYGSAFPSTSTPKAAADTTTLATLDLGQAQKLARERSPLVRLARSRFEQKDAEFEIARRSPLPKFTGTMGYLYQSNPNGLTQTLNREANSLRSGAQDPETSEMQTRNEVRMDKNSAVIGVGALQILYAGGYFDARQELAVRERELGELEVRLSEFELDILVRDVFLGILVLEEKVKLHAARVAALGARLEALAAAARERAVGESQVTEAEIEVLKGRRESREAEGELGTRRSQLNALLGRPDGTPVSLALPEEMGLGFSPSQEPHEAALARHPVLAKGLKQIAAAESYMKLVRSQEMFVPKAFAFGGVDHTRGLGSNGRLVNWSMGVGVVVPLFDGGVRNEETRKALALRTQAETGYEMEVSRVKEQTREAMLKLERARDGAELARRARALADRGIEEAERATAAAQLPRYRLEEIRVKRLEAELALLAARAEVLRWQSVLSSLTGVEIPAGKDGRHKGGG